MFKRPAGCAAKFPPTGCVCGWDAEDQGLTATTWNAETLWGPGDVPALQTQLAIRVSPSSDQSDLSLIPRAFLTRALTDTIGLWPSPLRLSHHGGGTRQFHKPTPLKVDKSMKASKEYRIMMAWLWRWPGRGTIFESYMGGPRLNKCLNPTSSSLIFRWKEKPLLSSPSVVTSSFNYYVSQKAT